MKVAWITSDDRETWRRYDLREPVFGTAPAAVLQGLATIPDLEVHVLSCIQKPVQSPEKLASNIWFHSLRVPKLGWLRSGYFGCIRAVRKKLRALGPDVVHAQGTERDCAISGVFSGFPHLLTIHGNARRLAALHHARPLSFGWLAARLEGFVLPRTDGILCITHHTLELVRRDARRTWVVPNAVDGRFFDLVAAPSLETNLLCVGTVCSHKNQNQLIRALDPIANTRRFNLVFLGGVNRNEPYGREFLDLVAQRPWCRFPGFADRATIEATLQTATMLVLPSLEDNCPMVVLEAMAAGVPVVAAKIGGLPDLIEEDVTGLFCDPNEPASIREAVVRLLDRPDWARHLASQAKARARLRFHPEVIARRHVEIYREILAPPGGGADARPV